MSKKSNPNYNAAVEALCALPPEQWASLNRGELLARGAGMVRAGKVNNTRAVNGSAIVGEITDETGKVRSEVSAQDKILTTACSCSGHAIYGCCEHVVALGLTVLQSGGRGDVLVYSPKTENNGLLSHYSQQPLHAIELRRTAESEFSLFAPLSVPQQLLWQLGFHGVMIEPNEGYFQKIEARRLVRSIERILKKTCDLGVYIRFVNDWCGQSPLLLSGHIQKKSLKIIGVLERGKRKLEFAVGSVVQNGDYALSTAYLDSRAFILENGNFAIGNSRLTEQLKFLYSLSRQNPTYGWNRWNTAYWVPPKVDLSCFNARQIKGETDQLSKILRDSLFQNGKGELQEWSELAEGELSIRLVARLDSEKDLSASLEVWLYRRKLDFSEALNRFTYALSQLRSRPAAEAGRDGFAYLTLLARATSLGLDTETQEIKRICSDDKRKKIRAWIDKWIGVTKKDDWLIYGISSRNRDPWIRCRDPRRVLYLMILSIWPMETREAVSQLRDSILLNDLELPAFFRRALPICEAMGVELRWGNRRVRSAPTKISVNWKETSDQDFLESAVKVSADGTEIPEIDWDKLISGDLILENRSRSVLIPTLSDQEALAFVHRKLAEKLKKKARKPAASLPESTSILELLQWAYRLKGSADLKMPDHVQERMDLLRGVRDLPDLEVPSEFQGELRPYQKTGYSWIHFLYKAGLGACLADEMGLGKTLQAIAFLLSIREDASLLDQKSLVVAPASVQGNWQAEFARFAPCLGVQQLNEVGVEQLASSTADILLTTFDCLVRHIKKLRKYHFYVVVVDEAQFAKNAQTARHKALALLSRKFLLALTGTPLENSSEDLVSILDLAIPGIRNFVGNSADLPEREEILQAIAQAFVLRRTKQAVAPSLPSKRIKDVKLTLTTSQAEIYNRFADEARETLELKREGESGSIELFAALTRLRQVCVDPRLTGVESLVPSPKLKKALEIVVKALRRGSSVLVFSQFTYALDLFAEELTEMGILPLRLDGSTPTKKRSSLVQNFQESEKPEVFLISLRAGGTGLNLTRATEVILMDQWWNPAVDSQAIDRAHRIGQSSEVQVWRLIMQGTIEDKILRLQGAKMAIFDDIVEESARRKSTKGILSSEDFEFLLG